MADEHWYVVRVREGFASIVAERLRRLNLDVRVADELIGLDDSSINPRRPGVRQKPANYVYCRFALKNRWTVTAIPGVLDVLGAPEPASVDNGIATLKRKRSHS